MPGVRLLLNMAKTELNNLRLRRYWFKTKERFGFRVTAYSLEDAKHLVDDAARSLSVNYEVLEILEDIDVRTLDQNHIVPNMGAPNFRDVWFPNLNL
jgi:hypothetical protein